MKKRLFIPLMAAGVLALAVVGIGAGFAQQGGGNVDTFLSKVAAKLGVSDDQMKTAVDQAYSETLDEQVAAGKLTQAQADALKARGFELGPMFGGGPGERSPLDGVQIMDAAAAALGMTRDDLMTQLRDGKSLADVATAQGISTEKLTADLLSQVKTQLDSLVSAGKLTQAQADSMYAKTQSNIDQIVSGQMGLFDGPGGIGGGGGGWRVEGLDMVSTAAQTLGMTTADLMTQLKDGKSLADVATAQGISTDKLTADLLAQVKTQLDSLVSAGKLTQAQADSMYAKTQSNIGQIVSGQMGLFGGGRGHGGPGGPGTGPMTAPSDNSTPEGTAQPGL